MSRRPTIVALVILLISISRMIMSPSIHQMRAVDLLTVFAGGVAAGVFLLSLVSDLRRRAEGG